MTARYFDSRWGGEAVWGGGWEMTMAGQVPDAFAVTTDEDRRRGLENAQAARTYRAEIRRAMKSGASDPIDVLDASCEDRVLGRMRVRMFLASIPGFGPKSVSDAMADLGVAETRRLSGLGERQFATLRNYLLSRRVPGHMEADGTISQPAGDDLSADGGAIG